MESPKRGRRPPSRRAILRLGAAAGAVLVAQAHQLIDPFRLLAAGPPPAALGATSDDFEGYAGFAIMPEVESLPPMRTPSKPDRMYSLEGPGATTSSRTLSLEAAAALAGTGLFRLQGLGPDVQEGDAQVALHSSGDLLTLYLDYGRPYDTVPVASLSLAAVHNVPVPVWPKLSDRGIVEPPAKVSFLPSPGLQLDTLLLSHGTWVDDAGLWTLTVNRASVGSPELPSVAAMLTAVSA